MKILKRWHYWSLTFITLFTVTAILAVIRFQSLPHLQFQVLVFLAIGYLSWAFVHHLMDKSFTFEIVIEYVLTATLALIVLYGLLL